MRSQIFLFLAVAVCLAGISGCGGPPPPNSTNTVESPLKTNTNNPLETTKTTPEETKNNAPTLTPVFKAYCDAKIKGDEAALRKIYSADTVKYFETQMKADKVKSLMKYLDDDKVTGKICEVRNEVITGDSAVAEIRADSYPNGIKIVFVKENGEWKMTNKSPAIESVKSALTSTTASNSTASNSTK